MKRNNESYLDYENFSIDVNCNTKNLFQKYLRTHIPPTGKRKKF